MAGELFPLFPEAVEMTPRVARKVVRHVAQGKPAALAVIQGFSMITLLVTNLISAALAGGISWYLSHRGVQGVKTDITNVKTEVSNLKEKLHGRQENTPAV